MKQRVPPQAIDLEKSVLGALLQFSSAVETAEELLSEDMFYHGAHKMIYGAMQALRAKGWPIDLNTVAGQLKTKEQLEMVGGAYYLTTLTNHVASSAHTEKYCHILVEKFVLRRVIELGGRLYQRGFEELTDPFDLLEEAEKMLHAIGASLKSRTFTSIDQTLVEVVRDLEEKRQRERHLTGVHTGFARLNQLTCGWQPTDLIILAARPKCGKTAMALSFAEEAATDGTGVGFFSLEMSAPQLVKRLLAKRASVYLQSLRDARLDDGQMIHLYENGVKKLAGLPFFIDDTAAQSLGDIKRKARQMVKNGAGLIVIDYLQLMQPDRGRKFQNREQEVATNARGLKILAKELNVPVIALSQLSREVEKRGSHVPQLSDLRESGSLEQDSDMVMFLYKPSEMEIQADASRKNIITLKAAAYRNGEPFLNEFEFDGAYQRFTELGEPKATAVVTNIGSNDGFPGTRSFVPINKAKGVQLDEFEEDPF